MDSSKVGSSKSKWIQPHFGLLSGPVSKKPKMMKIEDEDLAEFMDEPFTETWLCSSETTNATNKVKHNPKKKIQKNWFDEFIPKAIEDLAVNKKKVQEVKDWIEKAVNNKKDTASFLLLTGPTGSGKTATVKTISKALNIKCNEWITPCDVEYSLSNDSHRDNIIYTPGQAEIFIDFLLQSRYQSVFSLMDDTKQLTLIEDFPNSFLREASKFNEVLRTYVNNGTCVPIIFICSDTKEKSSNIPKILFPPTVREEFSVENIQFNAVATTQMKQLLKNAITLMNKDLQHCYKTLSQDCIDSIMNSSNGDIRNAIINLHFSALKDSSSIPITFQPTSENKKSKNKNKNGKLNNVGCDENVNLMHAIGRVLYPKRTSTNSNWKLTHDPDSIINQFSSISSTFVAFLHENYPTHFSNINDICAASDDISIADILSQEWKEKDFFGNYALSVSIRSLMVHNEKPVSSWSSVRGPKFINNTNDYRKDQNYEQLGMDALLDYAPYKKIIVGE